MFTLYSTAMQIRPRGWIMGRLPPRMQRLVKFVTLCSGIISKVPVPLAARSKA